MISIMFNAQKATKKPEEFSLNLKLFSRAVAFISTIAVNP
jgi:hypothetical protein